jgi:nucleoside-triphosphatase
MKKNIILTGEPGVGKSTLLIKIVEEVEAMKPGICHGFYTQEIKRYGKRVGFKMAGTVIAHVDSESEIRVSRYGVETNRISNIALGEIIMIPKEAGRILYLDEIGQMQLNSEIFKTLVKRYLDSKCICIATLTAVYHSQFTRAVRNRKDIMVINVTPGNREELLSTIPTLIKNTL